MLVAGEDAFPFSKAIYPRKLGSRTRADSQSTVLQTFDDRDVAGSHDVGAIPDPNGRAMWC